MRCAERCYDTKKPWKTKSSRAKVDEEEGDAYVLETYFR